MSFPGCPVHMQKRENLRMTVTFEKATFRALLRRPSPSFRPSYAPVIPVMGLDRRGLYLARG